MSTFAILLIATLALGASADLEGKWAAFKAEYNKQYTPQEEQARKYIYSMNLKKIEEHNELYAKGLKDFFLGENHLSDMTAKETASKLNGLRMPKDFAKRPFPVVDPIEEQLVAASLPKAVDWRDHGYVTPVKNQGECGSCWAFSTTGSLEGQHFKATGKLVSLSEQQLVDCSYSYGNFGCMGGLMEFAFEYIEKYGLDTEAAYPYKAYMENNCHYIKSAVGATEKSYVNITSGSEIALQKAVATIGPISVAMDASSHEFQTYKGGIYNPPSCSSTELDHGVLVVGYGTTNEGKDYWLVKNSWTTKWGMDGYFMLARNDNNRCGVATMASYPVV